MVGERTLPGLGLRAYWELESDGYNEQLDPDLRKLSVLTQAAAISKTTDLPMTPVDGDIYIVPAAAAENANQIAAFDEGGEGWIYYEPMAGWKVWIGDVGATATWDGSEWVVPEGEENQLVAATHWRIYITENNGNANYTVAVGVEFRDESGVDLVGPGEAIASTEANPASDAFQPWSSDSIAYWTTLSGFAEPSWVGYIFLTPVTIRQFTLTGVREADRNPQNFAMQYSLDGGATWETAETYEGETGWSLGGVDTRVFDVPPVFKPVNEPLKDAPANDLYYLRQNNEWIPVQVEPVNMALEAHRFWRVNTSHDDRFIRIDDLMFIADPGGEDQTETIGGTPIASHAVGTVPNAFDGSLTSRWDTGNVTGLVPWIGFEFNEPVRVGLIRIYPDTSEGQNLVKVGIEYSDDGVEWFLAWEEEKAFTPEMYHDSQNPDYGAPDNTDGIAIVDAGDASLLGAGYESFAEQGGQPDGFILITDSGFTPIEGSVIEDPSFPGTFAYRFGDIDGDEKVGFDFTFTAVEDGTFYIESRNDSEINYDYMEVYLDGVLVLTTDNVSGAVYNENTFDVSAGTHTVRAYYLKDGTTSQGLDTTFIRRFRFIPELVDGYQPGAIMSEAGSIYICATQTFDIPSVDPSSWVKTGELVEADAVVEELDPTEPHVYWGFRFIAPQSGSALRLQEARFLDLAGNNITSGGTWADDQAGGFASDYETTTLPVIFYYEFPIAVEVGFAEYYNYGPISDVRVKDFEIVVSDDGENWTTVYGAYGQLGTPLVWLQHQMPWNIAEVREETGTADSAVANDVDRTILLTNAAAITATIPPDIFNVGDVLTWIQGGAGSITVNGGSGVTVHPAPGFIAASIGQWATMSAIMIRENEWVLTGQLEAV